MCRALILIHVYSIWLTYSLCFSRQGCELVFVLCVREHQTSAWNKASMWERLVVECTQRDGQSCLLSLVRTMGPVAEETIVVMHSLTKLAGATPCIIQASKPCTLLCDIRLLCRNVTPQAKNQEILHGAGVSRGMHRQSIHFRRCLARRKVDRLVETSVRTLVGQTCCSPVRKGCKFKLASAGTSKLSHAAP